MLPDGQQPCDPFAGRRHPVTADLPALRPFFHDSARFFTALQPGALGSADDAGEGDDEEDPGGARALLHVLDGAGGAGVVHLRVQMTGGSSPRVSKGLSSNDSLKSLLTRGLLQLVRRSFI